jgi:hypothetical protein
MVVHELDPEFDQLMHVGRDGLSEFHSLSALNA